MANMTGKESAVIHMGANTQSQDMDSTARSFKRAKNAEIKQTNVMIPELLVVECMPDFLLRLAREFEWHSGGIKEFPPVSLLDPPRSSAQDFRP